MHEQIIIFLKEIRGGNTKINMPFAWHNKYSRMNTTGMYNHTQIQVNLFFAVHAV